MLFKKNKNRKWQQRPQLYKGRFFYLRRIAQVCLVIFAFISIISFVLYLKNSEAMSIKKIEVLGELKHMDKSDVIAMAGIRKSNRLFTLSLHNVQKRIMKHPWIEEVRLRRKFPDTIQVFVREHKPVALFLANELYYMNSSGVVFKKVKPNESKNFPVITGFLKRDIDRYPNLTKISLRRAFDSFKFFHKQSFFTLDPISEIHYDPIEGITLFTRDKGLEIYYGNKDIIERHAKLEKFKLSKDYKKRNFKRLDLSARGKIIARK